MPEISDIVNVTISTTPKGVTRQGFGVPMLLSAHFKWPERARVYTNPDSMLDADFDVNDPEYLMANAMFSQARQPTSLIVGRQKVDTIGSVVSSTMPTPSLVATITVQEVYVGGFYSLKIGGSEYGYLAVTGDSVDDVATGWAAAIDAHADYTATAVGAVITVTKTTSGAFRYAAWVKLTNASGDVVDSLGDLFTVGGTATYSATVKLKFDSTIPGAPSARMVAFNGLIPGGDGFSIVAVSTGADTFSVTGDYTERFVAGRTFTVTGSTGNDGSYVVISSVFSTPNTVISVAVVPNATADGSITLLDSEIEVVDRLESTITGNGEFSSFVDFTDLTGGAYKVALNTIPGQGAAVDYFSLEVDARQTITTGTFGRGTLESPAYGFAIAETAVEALVKVQAENADWFWTLLMESDPDVIDAVAENYVESRIRYMFACTDQADIVDVSEALDTTSVAAVLKAGNFAKTRVFFHDAPDQFPDAAIVGAIAPLTPGSYDTTYITLVGVTASDLTDTQRANALAKGVMLYSDFAGTGNTEEGESAVVEYTDVVVGNMFVDVNMEADVFDLLRARAAAGRKVPYTDIGIGLVENVIRARLASAEAQGIYVVGSSVVSVPKRSATSSADRAARHIRNVTFTADLQGAIRFVTVTGNVSV